jgi:hypothetical protein
VTSVRLPVATEPPVSLDYLAGFIDGEGCFSASLGTRPGLARGRYCRCVMIVTSCEPDALVRAQITVGGGRVLRVMAPSRQRVRWKASYRLTVQGADLDRFLPRIIPHLIVKREVATQLLVLRQLIARTGYDGRRIPAQSWAERERIVARIHELNRRGPAGIGPA